MGSRTRGYDPPVAPLTRSRLDFLPRSNHPRVVELLCAAPGVLAALNLRNQHGRTPLAAAARRHGRDEVAAVLRSFGASL